MLLKKFTNPEFLKTKEFKLFLTVWLIYIFYLQMYGSSCMANSQSGLTAAIVNEHRFKVDTYYRTSCDVAYYNGHYYSGQPPGISFLAVPLYAASKQIFHLLPDGIINSLYEKLEKYGDKVGTDYWGKKKILSNYFVGLSKRQILEYVFISGFILPIFTTALISAISVALFYAFLGRFTNNEKLRIGIALIYAFGTSQFPSSTLFMERPIAIALMFAAFFILFKIRHKELKPKGAILFFSGLLAGLSTLFDYFPLFASGLLLIYLLSFLNKSNFVLLLNFIIGMSIPVILLFAYQYSIFDNPFTDTYSYRIVSASDHTISDIFKIKLPDMETLFYMLEFFMYSPIMLLAFYGVYNAFLKQDKYCHDIAAVGIFIIFTLIYSTALALVYPVSVAPHFRRHMSPTIPYAMLFLPYTFLQSNKTKSDRAKKILVIFGIISIFINWVHVQQKLDLVDFKNKQSPLMSYFLKHGPSSSFLETFAGVFHLNSLLTNFVGLAALTLLIYFIWKPYLKKAKQML